MRNAVSDMHEVLAEMKRGNARAKLAVEIFVHRLQAGIGSMAAVLGGMDALIFTGGIGEHSPEIREATCANLAFLGVQVVASKNSDPLFDVDIAQPVSNVRVLVIRAHEEWAIARECWKLLG